MSLLILHPNKLRPGAWYTREDARLISIPDWLAAILISVGLHAIALPWLPAPESRVTPMLEEVRQSLVVMLGANPVQEAVLAMPTVSLDAVSDQTNMDPFAATDPLLADAPSSAIELPFESSAPVRMLALDATVAEQAQMAVADVAYSEVALSSLVIETGLDAEETVVAENLQAPSEPAKSSEPTTSRAAPNSIGRYGRVPGIDSVFQQRLASHIQGFVAYVKKISEDRKIEGQAMIRYEIDRQGNLLQSEITRTSGHTELDQAILKMLEFASPMVPLPDEHPTGRQFFGQTISVWLKSVPVTP